jgi:hypothetical protein
MRHQFDPEPNRRVHVILVVMLITLAILCFCSKISNGAEPVPQPVNLRCVELSDHIQEKRACSIMEKSIQKHKRLRLYEQDRDSWFVWYAVYVGFDDTLDDSPEIVFVSVNTSVCLPTFEGICMAIWTNAFVTSPHDLIGEVRRNVDLSVGVYDWFLGQALPVLNGMRFEPCPDPYNEPPRETAIETKH